MIKKAVDTHNATRPLQAPPSRPHQQHINASAGRPSTKPSLYNTHPNTRPLSTGTGNIIKPNGNIAGQGAFIPLQGVKRTSSGLAKALDSQEDIFEYPATHIGRPAPVSRPSTENAAVYFDEDDFDSDIDLDVEDPATKGTVTYPTLPEIDNDSQDRGVAQSNRQPTSGLGPNWDTDSGYGSHSAVPSARGSHGVPQKDRTAHHPRTPVHEASSQPIPWSSSPLDHHKPPARASIQPAASPTAPQGDEPRPTKRRTLPWLEQVKKESVEQEVIQRMEAPAKKPRGRPSKESRTSGEFTPLPKDSSRSAYPWNTTASAVKEQQKNLRQANKKLTKTNEATDEGLKDAIAKKKKNKISRVFLSEEQQHVLNLVVEQKRSVFFTGSAGTGKSVLLREIISSLRKKYAREPDRVAVTASTGLAACNVGGVTLHSFAGIGLGKEPAEELVKKIRKNQKARHRWMRTKVLVVDEVSMVDGELFDKLEQIARTIRNNGRPFGGIQVVITGDFFQLPPVPDSGRVARFAFDAGTWTTVVEHTIGLHHVFRQKDPVFANMLNEMREGRLTPASIAAFRKLDRPLHKENDLEATELFPTRSEVDRANHLRMQQLHGDVYSFEARDGGTIQEKAKRDKLLQNCMAPEVIHLKKGAQVMLIKNIDDTLVNGSLGKVIGFMSESSFDKYTEDEENFHVGEGEDGDGISIKSKLKSDLLGITTTQIYPVVRFAIADGTTRDLLCNRESWKVELPNGEVQASRGQVPLILAWALSIHKAQGQTLERVKVDLGKVFEKGQAYVALSRAVSMEGLQVLRFDPKKVVAHDKVRNFYSSLSRAEETNGKKLEKKKQAKLGVAASDYEKDFIDNSGWDDEEALAALHAAG